MRRRGDLAQIGEVDSSLRSSQSQGVLRAARRRKRRRPPQGPPPSLRVAARLERERHARVDEAAVGLNVHLDQVSGLGSPDQSRSSAESGKRNLPDHWQRVESNIATPAWRPSKSSSSDT